MHKEATRTLNPDHPDHPKNIAARAALQANTSIPNGQVTTESTESQPDDLKSTSEPPQETVKAGSHAGTKVEKSPEPVGPKVWSSNQLFTECLAFTNDFANAGNLTGRAMLSFIERAQHIMNEYKKSKDQQKGKKK